MRAKPDITGIFKLSKLTLKAIAGTKKLECGPEEKTQVDSQCSI
jgi:hypothetical protein